jgi:hypothetical protein
MSEHEFRQVFEATSGILFLGSLHNEDHPAFEELALRCAAIEFRATSKKVSVIDTLRSSGGWPPVKDALARFRGLHLSIPIRSFFETRESVYHSSRWSPDKSTCVCLVYYRGPYASGHEILTSLGLP